MTSIRQWVGRGFGKKTPAGPVPDPRAPGVGRERWDEVISME